MTTSTPTSPPRPPVRRRTPRRIRIPALSSMDLDTEQHRNLRMARRRLRNVAQKVYDARTMLADAPPEVDASVRNDLWSVLQLLQRVDQKLLLKRGRKPQSRPHPLPAEKPSGVTEDSTAIVAV